MFDVGGFDVGSGGPEGKARLPGRYATSNDEIDLSAAKSRLALGLPGQRSRLFVGSPAIVGM